MKDNPLTFEEQSAVQSAIWRARSEQFGTWKLTDDGMFGEIAFDAEQKYRVLDSAMQKLRAAKII